MINTDVFDLMVNIAAAFIGLSYPLFQQIIQQIDSKYDSILIVRAFRKERTYKTYNYLMLATIGWVIYMPFAPACNKDLEKFYINYSASIIATILLVLTIVWLIKLSKLIWTYNDPLQLTHRFLSKYKNECAIIYDKTDFQKYADLYKYSLKKGNTELFLVCNSVIGECIGLYHADHKDQEIIYPDYFYKFLNEYTRLCITVDAFYPTLTHPENILATVLTSSDFFDNNYISLETLRCVWYNLLIFINEGKKDWLIGYWTYASSQADLYRDKPSNSTEKVNEDFRYKLMHHILCGYLLFKREYTLLHEIFTYSNNSFGKRTLIPSSLDEIIDMIIYLKKEEKRDFLYLERNYAFLGTEKGVYNSSFIYKWLIIFYIFCLIKSNYDFDNYSRPSNIKSHIVIRIIDDLLANYIIAGHIYKIYKSEQDMSTYETFSGEFSKGYILNSIGQLKGVRQRIKEEEEEIINKSPISGNKVNDFKTELSGIMNKKWQKMPLASERKGQEVRHYQIKFKESVSKNMFSSITPSSFSNLPDVIASVMEKDMVHFYESSFLLNNTTINYYINYDKLQEALSSLSIPETCGIISLGVPLEGTGFAPEFNVINSQKGQLIIMKKSDIPTFIKHSNEIELNTIITSSDDTYKDTITSQMDIELQYQPGFRYIRIVVINEVFDGRKSNIDKIQPLNTYIV